VNAQAVENRLAIPVDNEHGALRLTVVLTFIFVWIGSFFVFSLLIPNDGISLLAGVIGFGAAYGMTATFERYLKRHWPSGRVVQIDQGGVKLERKGNLQQEMMSEDPVNVLLWSFKIPKQRGRVQKGWSMLACGLEYDNQYLTIYTFMSPKEFETFDMAKSFKTLLAKRKGKNDAREDLRVAGEQRRLRDAENYRWLNGGEVTPSDFITYLTQIKTLFPEWMPLN
jgi:hypothetical protein